MEESYTNQEATVLMLYHELTADLMAGLTERLHEDADLRESFSGLSIAMGHLPRVMFDPSQKVLNNILQYSTKTAMEAHL
jgi:hypothetical protein